MSKVFYLFLSFIVVITVFITTFQSQNSSLIYAKTDYYWPTPAYHHITSYFGRRESPTAGASTFHQGVDIAAVEGSGVSAMADGEVIYASFHKNGGYMVVISHSRTQKSYYEHLSKEMYVKKGDIVKKGEVIGTVGPKYVDGKLNGTTTGAHLHFGVYQNGEYINPLELF